MSNNEHLKDLSLVKRRVGKLCLSEKLKNIHSTRAMYNVTKEPICSKDVLRNFYHVMVKHFLSIRKAYPDKFKDVKLVHISITILYLNGAIASYLRKLDNKYINHNYFDIRIKDDGKIEMDFKLLPYLHDDIVNEIIRMFDIDILNNDKISFILSQDNSTNLDTHERVIQFYAKDVSMDGYNYPILCNQIWWTDFRTLKMTETEEREFLVDFILKNIKTKFKCMLYANNNILKDVLLSNSIIYVSVALGDKDNIGLIDTVEPVIINYIDTNDIRFSTSEISSKRRSKSVSLNTLREIANVIDSKYNSRDYVIKFGKTSERSFVMAISNKKYLSVYNSTYKVTWLDINDRFVEDIKKISNQSEE